jgi:hypothetical protein
MQFALAASIDEQLDAMHAATLATYRRLANKR